MAFSMSRIARRARGKCPLPNLLWPKPSPQRCSAPGFPGSMSWQRTPPRSTIIASPPIRCRTSSKNSVESTRLHLNRRIAQVMAASERKRLTIHDAIKLPSRQTARLISEFVNYLGFLSLPEAPAPKVGSAPVFAGTDQKPGLPVLEEAPQHYERQYTRTGLKAYLEFVTLNATSDPTGGRGETFFNPVANQRLGDLLEVAQ